jgi:antitoxin component YwqK of YwqJK toxin-antitoxin module
MTKKPETVKQEDLIRRKDGLTYKKYARIPFTGVIESFDDDPQLRRRENYKNGKEDGLMELFHKYGQLLSKGNFKNGERHGFCEKFDKEGNLIEYETWVNRDLTETIEF